MKNLKYLSIILIIVVLVVLIGGCAGEEKPPDQVTVQLKWIHQAQFAGVYAADSKGFYAEENIDVTLNAGGSDIPPSKVIADLITGEASFAIVGGEQLLAARSQGKPVVAIAVVFQKNPYVYVSLKGSGIERPQDFMGKKVMVPSDGKIQHEALLRKLSLDPSDVTEITSYARDVMPLTTGQIDAHMLYRTGTGLAFDETGYELNFIWLDDYGIRFYADTIVAIEELAQQNPELVERFLRATLKGWRYTIENPDEAVDLTLQYDATLGRERQARMVEAQAPLIHTGDAEIGWMEDSIWQEMHQMLLEGDVIEQPVNLAEAYTMEFLEKIYSNER